MEKIRTGFAVVYRWRLKPGAEAAFQDAWARTTRAICRDHGGLGSRLHRVQDGTWLAYAQWPDRQAWEALQSLSAADSGAANPMSDCVEERFPPLLLEPVADLLVAVTGTDHHET
jgi:quinol monooxygenase YgiN